jgi:thiol-disulfide isomerase/thioredoxin
MSRPASLAGLVVVACAALAAGYFFARERTPPAEPPAAEAPRSAVPDVRPVFELDDQDGVRRSITEWDGRALMINFWATWCPPCRREIPLLNELQARYAPRGFQVVGIAVDFREDVLAYMRDTPIDYPVLIGEQEGLDAAQAFGMETMGFPFTVFTDSRGRIVTVHLGELHPPQAEVILAAVADVDAGRLDLEAARERIRADLPSGAGAKKN